MKNIRPFVRLLTTDLIFNCTHMLLTFRTDVTIDVSGKSIRQLMTLALQYVTHKLYLQLVQVVDFGKNSEYFQICLSHSLCQEKQVEVQPVSSVDVNLTLALKCTFLFMLIQRWHARHSAIFPVPLLAPISTSRKNKDAPKTE